MSWWSGRCSEQHRRPVNSHSLICSCASLSLARGLWGARQPSVRRALLERSRSRKEPSRTSYNPEVSTPSHALPTSGLCEPLFLLVGVEYPPLSLSTAHSFTENIRSQGPARCLPVFSLLRMRGGGWPPRPAQRPAPSSCCVPALPLLLPVGASGGRGARRSGRNRCSGCLWAAAGSCPAPSRGHLIWVLG